MVTHLNGKYNNSLILIMVIFMISNLILSMVIAPTAVYADSYLFSAPEDINFGEMAPRIDPYLATSSGSITGGDNPSGYTITVIDAKTDV